MPSKAICILTLKSSLKLAFQLHLCKDKLDLWQRPDKTKTAISIQSTKHVQNCLNAYFWQQLVKSVNSNCTLAVRSRKFGQAKTHFLSHWGKKGEKI